MFSTNLIVFAGALARLADAHGGGMHYTIDGTVHLGNWDIWGNNRSIQRLWHWDSVSYLDDPNIACGKTGEPSVDSYHAPLRAGNIVRVNYTNDELDPDGKPYAFGHKYGPLSAYLGRCPDSGCEEADINSKIWFKIWEAGLISGTWGEGHWAMTDFDSDGIMDIPVPASLKSGKYLMRHEALNLQTGPAQFFMNCIQLDVSGSGNSLPQPEKLVSFPGAYDDDEEKSFSINNGNDFFYLDNWDSTVYPMPGPEIWEG